MGRPSLAVVGSVNLDVVVTCARLPEPGETLLGTCVRRSPGGKGANQALAARRLGAEVAMVAGVGDDQDATDALALLRGDGVDLSAMRVFEGQASGLAIITVAPDGENTIVVVPGTNGALQPDDVPTLASQGTLCQLEVPVEVVQRAADVTDGLFVLNAAPAPPELPPELVGRADVLIVNEVEHRTLEAQLADAPGLVVVTRGAAGATALRRGQQVARAGAPRVEAIDAVGAGDAFAAAFTVAMLEELTLTESLRFACTAGALATTRRGAQDALPTRHQVDELSAALLVEGG